MWPHCRLDIAHCQGLQTWIFGQTLWTDADQTFTIRTPLLTRYDVGCRRGNGIVMLATLEALPPLSSTSSQTSTSVTQTVTVRLQTVNADCHVQYFCLNKHFVMCTAHLVTLLYTVTVRAVSLVCYVDFIL